MAKFKVGDKVEIIKGPTPSIGDFGTVGVPVAGKADGMFGDAAGENLVSLIGPGGKHVVPESWLKLRNSACNSKNPVVAKAMNACGTARNAKAEFVQPYVRGDATDNGVSIRLIKLQDEIKDATADGCAAKAFQQVKLLREVANSLEKVAKWVGSLV